jgi:hypothetical protein
MMIVDEIEGKAACWTCADTDHVLTAPYPVWAFMKERLTSLKEVNNTNELMS